MSALNEQAEKSTKTILGRNGSYPEAFKVITHYETEKEGIAKLLLGTAESTWRMYAFEMALNVPGLIKVDPLLFGKAITAVLLTAVASGFDAGYNYALEKQSMKLVEAADGNR